MSAMMISWTGCGLAGSGEACAQLPAGARYGSRVRSESNDSYELISTQGVGSCWCAVFIECRLQR